MVAGTYYMDVIPAILRSGALTSRPPRRRWGHPPPRGTRRQRFERLWHAPALRTQHSSIDLEGSLPERVPVDNRSAIGSFMLAPVWSEAPCAPY